MKPTRNSLAPTPEQSERLNEATKTLAKQFCAPLIKLTKTISERLRTSTKLERLLFACCVYYGGMLLIFKIMGV